MVVITNAGRASGDELGVFAGSGGRDHHGTRPGQVRRIRTGMGHGPGTLQVGEGGGVHITPGDGHATASRGERECTHAGTADSEEMQRSWITGIKQGRHPDKIRVGLGRTKAGTDRGRQVVAEPSFRPVGGAPALCGS